MIKKNIKNYIIIALCVSAYILIAILIIRKNPAEDSNSSININIFFATLPLGFSIILFCFTNIKDNLNEKDNILRIRVEKINQEIDSFNLSMFKIQSRINSLFQSFVFIEAQLEKYSKVKNFDNLIKLWTSYMSTKVEAINDNILRQKLYKLIVESECSTQAEIVEYLSIAKLAHREKYILSESDLLNIIRILTSIKNENSERNLIYTVTNVYGNGEVNISAENEYNKVIDEIAEILQEIDLIEDKSKIDKLIYNYFIKIFALHQKLYIEIVLLIDLFSICNRLFINNKIDFIENNRNLIREIMEVNIKGDSLREIVGKDKIYDYYNIANGGITT